MMKRHLLYFFFLLPFCSLTAQDTTIDTKIKKMLNLMGSNERFEAVIDHMLNTYKDLDADTYDEGYWNSFAERFKNTGIEELQTLLLPIYKKYLTESEIDTIIQFYESPTGRSLVTKFPVISLESMKVGEEWGLRTGTEIMEALEKEKEDRFYAVPEGCAKFHEGVFTEFYTDEYTVRLERDSRFQTEIRLDGKTKYKIEWITPCKYVLHNSRTDTDLAEEPLETNIYEVSETSYKYIARIRGSDYFLTGEHVMVKK
jgi:uncharacterized protein